MLNFALPYVVIGILLLIISPKFIDRNYLFATNFVYSLLAISFLLERLIIFGIIWYSRILPETLAFLNRVLSYGIFVHFGLLFLSSILPFLFLFRKFRISKKLLFLIIFSALLGILDGYLYPEKIQPGWHTMVSPVFNQYYMLGATVLLIVGCILLVKLKILPEFKTSKNNDILDVIEN